MLKTLHSELFRFLRYALLVTGWGLTFNFSYAQGSGTQVGTEQHVIPRIPASPTTEALERYVTMPVSEHTGTPQVSIPLFEVKSRQLSVPISLSYHASGVRVTDDASWVGLGWSLQAGGMISRMVRGLPDEQLAAGYLVNCQAMPDTDAIDQLNNGDFTFLKSVADNRLDLEPDLFSYTFPGGNGQFMFGNDGKAHLFPYSPLTILPNLSTGTGQVTLVAPSGDIYQFADWESTTIRQRGPDLWHRSAWYLSRIISADATDTISFEYTRHRIAYAPTTYQQQTLPIYTLVEPGIPTSHTPSGVVTTVTNVETQAVKLHRIRFANGYVQFNADSTSRLDIPTDARLLSVVLYKQDSPRSTATVLRTFTLDHSYFQSTGGNSPRLNYRLRLDAVTESNGLATKPSHQFGYSPIPLPPRDSYAQDHWGYYNHQANADLIPRQVFSTPYGPQVVGQANREPDSVHVQAGILQRIVYPTGATASLRYEAHTVDVLQPLPRSIISHRADALATSRTPVFVSTRFQLPVGSENLRAKLTMSINCYPDPTGSGWPKNTGAGSLNDISMGSGSLPAVRRIGGCGASTVNPSTGLSDSVSLSVGRTYELLAQSDNPDMETEVRVEWEDTSQPIRYEHRTTLTGGVRILRITTSAPGQPSTVKSYDYNVPSFPQQSSGSRIGLSPKYHYEREIRFGVDDTPPGGEPVTYCSFYMNAGRQITISSNNIGQTGTETQPVAYSSVTIYNGVNNGKTVNTYSAEPDEEGPYGRTLPFVPSKNNSWKRGLLLSQSTYSYNNGTYHILERQKNRYSIDSRNTTQVNGFKAARRVFLRGCVVPEGLSQYNTDHFVYANTVQNSYWQHLDAMLTKRYNPLDSMLSTSVITLYTYHNPVHAQITTMKATLIGGDTAITTYRYPTDYSSLTGNTGAAQSIYALANRHVMTALIEETHWVKKAGIDALTSATVTHYDGTRPRAIWQLRAKEPVSATAFRPSAIQNGQFEQDERYQETVVVDSYDAYGNVQQQHRIGELPTTYLWGYNSTQLIARIENASYAEVVGVLGQATVNRLAASQPDALIQQDLQRLRGALKNARVSSYTYQPLVGMNSQTDPSGRTIFYEYDGLGRLLRTRDEQNRVLAEQQYQYARP